MPLVEDERARVFSLDVISRVAGQLLQVGGHESGRIRVDVEEDTVHHRAVVLVGGCVDGPAYAVHQRHCRKFNGDGIRSCGLALRIVVRVEIRQGGFSAGPGAFELVLAYCPDGERLVRQFPEKVVQLSGRDGDSAVAFLVIHCDRGLHRDFLVRCGNLEQVSAQGEEIVFQNGFRRLGRNGL